MLALFFSCSQINDIACFESRHRLVSIQDQRGVLSELKATGKIGKKKFKTIDGVLEYEEALEISNIKRSCENVPRFL